MTGNAKPDLEGCRSGLLEAGRRRVAAIQEHEAATAELASWCRRARKAGLGVTEIARLAGVSREWAYQLLQATAGANDRRTR